MERESVLGVVGLERKSEKGVRGWDGVQPLSGEGATRRGTMQHQALGYSILRSSSTWDSSPSSGCSGVLAVA